MDGYEILYRTDKLKNNTYPGRGIILGVTPDGTKKVCAYFIMGRSQNSRNRVFTETADGICTEAFDPSLLQDPSLIIYHPVRMVGDVLICTNGDQTDTIAKAIMDGGTFEEALRTREFEPDGPNWTPRISGIVAEDGSYKLSILKSADAEGTACVRQFFEYPPMPGVGHFIHTYVTDGNPIPTFQGEPERVDISDDLDTYAGMLWTNLNSDNKVSLFVRYTDIETGEYEQLIVNDNT